VVEGGKDEDDRNEEDVEGVEELVVFCAEGADGDEVDEGECAEGLGG
jgi:hypothetical protein